MGNSKKYLSSYDKFDKIDGSHDFKKYAPESFIDYNVRYRDGGKLFYFNFDLAKELGLIEDTHPNKLNSKLEKKIMETFSLVIINEYDIENNIEFDSSTIKKNKYMATRYLQLQHKDGRGLNSGDGRSIWNGQIKHKGLTWDLSSCGSGATRLSPATTEYNKFFQTGDPSISYGCGYSEIDEDLGTAIYSNVFAKSKMPTEKVLCVIEFPNNISICVRAYPNLIRPSHMFNHLKQGNFEELNNVFNYYYDREVKNKSLPSNNKIKNFMDKVVDDFAKTAANFEDEYIFCWIDWDGDNILMDGGIIDYGSIRQLGLYHDEYKFEDVDRYSTTLKEQKGKIRILIRTFAQMVDFLKHKEKKSIEEFNNSKYLDQFDNAFMKYKYQNLLAKVGLREVDYTSFLNKKSNLKLLNNFMKDFSFFEKKKSTIGEIEVADGVTVNAVCCMRDILRELPQIYLAKEEIISDESFIEIIRSSYATDDDFDMNQYLSKKIKSFQKNYMLLVDAYSKFLNCDKTNTLEIISQNSARINKYDKVTGDSVSIIVQKLLKSRKHMSVEKLYQLIEDFSCTVNSLKSFKDVVNNKHLYSMFEIVREYREGL